jgi:uncharacterized protein (DUF58 family)
MSGLPLTHTSYSQGISPNKNIEGLNFLKKIRRIEITTRRMVTDVFAGQYHSVFKGRGMEFDEVREYQVGDDIRSIDWNVTARSGRPHVKKFVEERELTVLILCDVSSSCAFGTSQQLKSQLAAEISSIFAFSAIRNNDKVGFIAFSDKIESFLPPRKSSRYALRVIREALVYADASFSASKPRKTDIKAALDFLNRVVTRRAVVFLISDFFDADLKKHLAMTSKRHDVIAISLTDPRERDLPDAGILKLNDPETGATFFVDSSDPKTREQYKKNSARLLDTRKRLFASVGIDHIDVQTNVPYMISLIKFFKQREKRRFH